MKIILILYYYTYNIVHNKFFIGNKFIAIFNDNASTNRIITSSKYINSIYIPHSFNVFKHTLNVKQIIIIVRTPIEHLWLYEHRP